MLEASCYEASQLYSIVDLPDLPMTYTKLLSTTSMLDWVSFRDAATQGNWRWDSERQ